jgi:hypothetical protein
MASKIKAVKNPDGMYPRYFYHPMRVSDWLEWEEQFSDKRPGKHGDKIVADYFRFAKDLCHNEDEELQHDGKELEKALKIGMHWVKDNRDMQILFLGIEVGRILMRIESRQYEADVKRSNKKTKDLASARPKATKKMKVRKDKRWKEIAESLRKFLSAGQDLSARKRQLVQRR